MMKKLLILFVILIILAAFGVMLFIRSNGGSFVKKAAKETYEVGKDMDKLKEDIIGKEKEAKKKIKNTYDDVKDKFD